jgi:hypothetical protein
MSNKIKNIEALLAEKAKLKELCKAKEEILGEKLDYIQDNLGIIALETILPINNAEKNSIHNLFDGLHSILQTFVPSLADKINGSGKWIKIIELVAASIFTRFFNSKTSS